MCCFMFVFLSALYLFIGVIIGRIAYDFDYTHDEDFIYMIYSWLWPFILPCMLADYLIFKIKSKKGNK